MTTTTTTTEPTTTPEVPAWLNLDTITEVYGEAAQG